VGGISRIVGPWTLEEMVGIFRIIGSWTLRGLESILPIVNLGL